ncbi:MAG: MmgE/PrpD family protein [Deltaproteobacteria bacterium]|nr:MmgE/PrpD family protein [Deltaproteobacteria bacterium]MBW2387071.1 MmgE/PrpD family protein [Deltaproteobacteria bacterium]
MAETAHHITRTLADFVATTRLANLPSEVVDYTKLVIPDSLICGIAAAGMGRSRMMHGGVEALQGPEEASVFGLGSKVRQLETLDDVDAELVLPVGA